MPEKSFLILKSNLTAPDIKQLASQWDLDSAIFANLFSQLDHINQKLNAVKRKIDYLDSSRELQVRTKETSSIVQAKLLPRVGSLCEDATQHSCTT